MTALKVESGTTLYQKPSFFTSSAGIKATLLTRLAIHKSVNRSCFLSWNY